ncbi:MAG: hypothetical protein WB816_05810 [Methylocystis sp.]
MELCDKPAAEMAFSEIASCSWDKGAKALSVAYHTPGSATINDWVWAFLAALILLNIFLFLVGILLPRR